MGITESDFSEMSKTYAEKVDKSGLIISTRPDPKILKQLGYSNEKINAYLEMWDSLSEDIDKLEGGIGDDLPRDGEGYVLGPQTPVEKIAHYEQKTAREWERVDKEREESEKGLSSKEIEINREIERMKMMDRTGVCRANDINADGPGYDEFVREQRTAEAELRKKDMERQRKMRRQHAKASVHEDCF